MDKSFNVTIDELLEILNHEKTEQEEFNEEAIETGFEISPHDFLKYAEDDLASTSSHKYINALSNAKRSLDCQLDTLLTGFGYYKIAKKEFWGFPRKVDLLQSLGVLTPRVLSKINRTRNLMEHEFKFPAADQVEDFIDIVSLFLAATGKYAFEFRPYKGIHFEKDEDGVDIWESKFCLTHLKGELKYKDSELEFVFFNYKGEKKGRSNKPTLLKKPKVFTIKVNAKDPKYKDLLKAFLQVDYKR